MRRHSENRPWVKNVIQLVRLSALVLHGFRYRYAKQYLELQCRFGENKNSLCRYVMRMMPLNGPPDKMFEDILSTRLVLTERTEVFPEYCAILVQRDGKSFFTSLTDEHSGEPLTFPFFLEYLNRYGSLMIRPCKNTLFEQAHRVCRDGDSYYLDHVQINEDQLKHFFSSLPLDTILIEDILPAADVVWHYGCVYPVLHIRVLNQIAEKPLFSELYVAEHGQGDSVSLYGSRKSVVEVNIDDLRVTSAMEFLEHLCSKFREIQYVNAAFVLTEHGFSVFQIDTGLDLCLEKEIPCAVCNYIKERQNSLEGRPLPFWRICRRYIFALIARGKGFVNFMYRNWLHGLKEDDALRSTSWREKYWAHKRGFYSYRIRQYGLTENNYRQFLSDYDYKRMRPLNNRYRKWFWDKLFTYYVLEAFPDYMPAYYARVITQKGKHRLIPFSGWAEGETEPDVVALLRQKRRLVVKPAVGSHGKGFHKLEYSTEFNQYFIDDCASDAEQVRKLIASLEPYSIISQYVDMHEDLKRIYGKVVCTIRITVVL